MNPTLEKWKKDRMCLRKWRKSYYMFYFSFISEEHVGSSFICLFGMSMENNFSIAYFPNKKLKSNHRLKIHSSILRFYTSPVQGTGNKKLNWLNLTDAYIIFTLFQTLSKLYQFSIFASQNTPGQGLRMTTIFFAHGSLGQQVQLGSPGQFCCCSHLGSLIQLKSSGDPPGAVVSVTCLGVGAGWWLGLIFSRLAQAYLHESRVLRGQTSKLHAPWGLKVAQHHFCRRLVVKASLKASPDSKGVENQTPPLVERATESVWPFKNMPQNFL